MTHCISMQEDKSKLEMGDAVQRSCKSEQVMDAFSEPQDFGGTWTLLLLHAAT